MYLSICPSIRLCICVCLSTLCQSIYLSVCLSIYTSMYLCLCVCLYLSICLLIIIIMMIDNFCIALFSGVPKLTALYNILQYFLSFTNIIHIIMTTVYNIQVHAPYEKQQYIKKWIIIDQSVYPSVSICLRLSIYLSISVCPSVYLCIYQCILVSWPLVFFCGLLL